MNLVPAFLEDFFCFREGNKIPGTVDVTLPKITPKSVTASGAGIAGDMDMPTKGQTENMETEITFRTTTEEVVALSQCKSTLVEFRGAQFVYNTGTGEYEKNPCCACYYDCVCFFRKFRGRDSSEGGNPVNWYRTVSVKLLDYAPINFWLEQTPNEIEKWCETIVKNQKKK